MQAIYFYLRVCTQGKIDSLHLDRTESPHILKGVLFYVFVNNQTHGFAGGPTFTLYFPIIRATICNKVAFIVILLHIFFFFLNTFRKFAANYDDSRHH